MMPTCPFSSANDDAVFGGLNLNLELKDPAQMPDLLGVLKAAEDEIRFRMKRLNSVHYARFLPTRGDTVLQVVTEYDGQLEDYLDDFIIEVGDIFNAILGFVRDAPPLPIQRDPDAFIDFVRRNNLVDVALFGPQELTVFSAYRRKTVVEINGRDEPEPAETEWWRDWTRRSEALASGVNAPPRQEAAPALADIQANIVEPLLSRHALHLALTIGDVAKARTFLRQLVGGDGSTGRIPGCPDRPDPTGQAAEVACPRLSNAADVATESAAFVPALTLGLTVEGLKVLGVTAGQIDSFPLAFRQGPVARAAINHDVAEHAPANWALGGPAQPVHLLLSLHEAAPAGHPDSAATLVGTATAFSDAKIALRRAIEAAGLKVAHEQACHLLDDERFHFGFRDGISQPRLAMGTAASRDPAASRIGEFLLGAGYRNAAQVSSLGRVPAEIGENGSFAVVRMLEQDVAAFEAMLDQASDTHQLCREFIAAKLLGRWRNGTPLAQANPPATCTGPGCTHCPPSPTDVSDDFDYRFRLNGIESPDADDHDGRVCPLGAHTRRMNPRKSRTAGVPAAHRVIRRGLPYGPAWHSTAPVELPRGLYGFFYCSDIGRQFEFLQRRWGYDGRQRGNTIGGGDPLCGAHGSQGTEGTAPAGFSFPLGTRSIRLDWKRLVTTRGCLYLFVPGHAALRRLIEGPPLTSETNTDLHAGQASGSGVRPRSVCNRASQHEPLDPADLSRFDPMHPAFIADPYPFYAEFRKQAPVARIHHDRDYSRVWVFSREHVTRVCADSVHFAKPLTGWPALDKPYAADPTERVIRGLFYLDGEKHEIAREALYPALGEAIRDIEDTARQLADQTLERITQREFDAVPAYIDRVTRDVFLTMFGVPEAQWDCYGTELQRMLENNNPLRSPAERSPYGVSARRLVSGMKGLATMKSRCPVAQGRDLFSRINHARHGLNPMEALQTALHFALGGYLSTAFALGTGIHRLVTDGAARAAFQNEKTRPAVIQEMLRFEAPFQTAERRATEDCELGGVSIMEGETINVMFGSANRDRHRGPRTDTGGGKDAGGTTGPVDDPTLEQFIPTRPAGAWADNPSFGEGVHRCIGAAMVEKVLPIYLERWLAAMPDLALADKPPTWINDPAYRGYKSLPMRY